MFKSQEEYLKLEKSGKILFFILTSIKNAIINGERSVNKLDNLAEEMLKHYDARSCKGYLPDFADIPFAYNLCASVNNEIVHGLPTKDKFLNDGDIVSIDMAIEHDGWFADSAFTIGVGNISDERTKLINATESCFQKGFEACTLGNTVGDIGHAIYSEAKKNGFSIAFALSGHGIGKTLHEDPYIPNFGNRGEGIKIEPGMSFCIEPMLIAGDTMISETYMGKNDGWTIYSLDGTDTAHYEHTIAITDNGPIILTG